MFAPKLNPNDKLDVAPVLIVGAGPTGLAAAMSLSRAHIPVRLVDKAREALPVRIEIRDARAMAEFEKRLDDAMLLEEFERARLNADCA